MLQIQHLNPKVLAKLYLINLIARSIEIIDVSWITSNGYPSFIGDSTSKKRTFDGLFTTLYTYYSFLYIKLLITRATVYTDSLIIIRCSKYERYLCWDTCTLCLCGYIRMESDDLFFLCLYSKGTQ